MSADIATQSLNLEKILRNVVVVAAAVLEATGWCPIFDASRGQKTHKKVLTYKIIIKKKPKNNPRRGRHLVMVARLTVNVTGGCSKSDRDIDLFPTFFVQLTVTFIGVGGKGLFYFVYKRHNYQKRLVDAS